ncbi:hypothetical protein [Massilia sp. TS11]|uniref:TolB family protein n=1 Tax=Massilia sp. TS11 TaxID=2908003 RepID=UPI001EDB8BAA|nr:hypothetical protein [Massilia sp. TS11]MCG2583219.1 hypothetical protein [Massilia sp. TS11]
MPPYARPLCIAICLFALYCFAHESVNQLHRAINRAAISPDSKQLAFSECTQQSPKQCKVFLFDRASASARQLDLLAGYNYTEPTFSPDGKKLVMVRSQLVAAQDWRTTKDVLQNTALVLLDLRTHDETVLPISHGHKFSPVFSPDGKQLAYFRSEVSLGFRFIHYGDADVFIYDLEQQKEFPFSAPFHFQQAYSIVFEAPDVLLINATSPLSDHSETRSFQEYDESKIDIYRIKRGGKFSASPASGFRPGSSNIRLDQKGGMYFLVRRVSEDRIVRRDQDGQEQSWVVSQFLRSTAVAPDGKSLIAIFADGNDPQDNSKHFVKELNLTTGTWRDLGLERSSRTPQPGLTSGRATMTTPNSVTRQ